jgi:hypothetical protein
MKKIASFIRRFRWFIIIFTVLFTVYSGYHLTRIKINSDVINSLPDDDPDAFLLKKIGNKYGGNKMGMVILETDNIFRTEVLENVATVTELISEIEGIASVTSLTNIMDIKSGGFGIEIGRLVDEWDMPETREQLEALRERVYSKEMYRGNIVSEDGTATVIIFTLLQDADAKKTATEVKEQVEALNLPEKVYFAGGPMMVAAIADLISTDLTMLLPIAFILIALVLYLGFRTKRGVILPLMTSAIAIVWAMGIMSMAGYEMSMVTNNIPIILLAVGSAYTIHVLNRIKLEREKDEKQALIKAVTYIIVPVTLAGLTTAVGFISFIFGAYLTMIQSFGIFTALGTLFALLLSIFFVPALFSIMRPLKHRPGIRGKNPQDTFMVNYLLSPLKNLLYRHPRNILYTWGILILISIVGIFMIKRNVNIQDYFKKNNPAYVAEEIMSEKFGGSKPVFVLFTGDMHDPEVLQLMMKMEEYMEESPHVLSAMSVADLIAQMNGVMSGVERVPDERDKIEQLWFLLDGQEYVERYVSYELDEGIILSKFTSSDNRDKKVFKRHMEEFIAEHSSEKYKIEVTGMPFVDLTMDKSLIRSQFGSLSIAIVFMIILVGVILRSLYKGIYATVPIVAAIIILFGFMGFTGISLNIATVLVASVALGIGIDYSIHIISHFNHTYEKVGDIYRAVRATDHDRDVHHSRSRVQAAA